jgi:CBS-domain-containing membrane protein
MVPDVVTVAPQATVREVAALLVKHRVSAVPVVDPSGRIVGIVSEGDLMWRAETGAERRRSWWLQAFSGNNLAAEDFRKANARRVSDLMTTNVVTAAPDTPLGEIAALLEKHHIKRVPIVAGDRLVGIVSRANLVQALATTLPSVPRAADDKAIRDAMLALLKREDWAPSQINVIVTDGKVELWGIVGSEAVRDALRVAAEATPGVKEVDNYVSVMPTTGGI